MVSDHRASGQEQYVEERSSMNVECPQCHTQRYLHTAALQEWITCEPCGLRVMRDRTTNKVTYQEVLSFEGGAPVKPNTVTWIMLTVGFGMLVMAIYLLENMP